MNGILWQTQHLIPTMRIMEHLNRLRGGVAEDEELVVEEGAQNGPWVEVVASIHKATS